MQRGLEERDVAVAPDPVALGAPEAGQNRDRRRVSGGEIDEREPALRRWAGGGACQRHPPCEALNEIVVARLRSARPGRAEPREGAADDPWVDDSERRIVQAEATRKIAAQIRKDHVGPRHEVGEDRPAGVATKIEGDAQLPSVEGLEEQAVLALLEGRHVASHVTSTRRILDLDHLGAEIRELQRGPGAGAVLLDGYDPNARERRIRADATHATENIAAPPSERGSDAAAYPEPVSITVCGRANDAW